MGIFEFGHEPVGQQAALHLEHHLAKPGGREWGGRLKCGQWWCVSQVWSFINILWNPNEEGKWGGEIAGGVEDWWRQVQVILHCLKCGHVWVCCRSDLPQAHQAVPSLPSSAPPLPVPTHLVTASSMPATSRLSKCVSFHSAVRASNSAEPCHRLSFSFTSSAQSARSSHLVSPSCAPIQGRGIVWGESFRSCDGEGQVGLGGKVSSGLREDRLDGLISRLSPPDAPSPSP